MQASMSNTLVHRKLVDVDFKSRYMTFSDMRLGASVDQNADADISNDRLIYHLQGVAFVVAYLLVLVIKVSNLVLLSLIFTKAVCFFMTILTQLRPFPGYPTK